MVVFESDNVHLGSYLTEVLDSWAGASHLHSDDAVAQKMVRLAGFFLILMFGCRVL